MAPAIPAIGLFAAVFTTCGEADASKHLLLDFRLVARKSNVRLVLGEVKKDPRNPLLVEDKPWEVRFDNLYPSVIFDEDEGIFKCWYNPFIVDEATSSTPAEQRKAQPYRPKGAREMGVCYATSRDGIVWEKPSLGIIEYEGSTQNNLVMRNIHGVGVWKDLHDLDPARRYKAFAANSAGVSPDGLHWTIYKCPEIEAAGDTHNNAFWDERTGRYVGVTRQWGEAGRIVARTESADYVKWTKAENVMQALPDQANCETYANIVFPYGNVYLGLVMLLDTQTDRVHCELAWSPDTVHWRRVCPGTPLIPPGPKGSFDWGCIYAAAYPILRDGTLLLYYAGGDDTHMSWRRTGLGLARLRPDGFAGMEPKDPTRAGTITTTPVECSGTQLRVSADAAGGELLVNVLDPEGRALLRSAPITDDVTDAPVRWAKGDLSALRGKQVRLRFRLEDARVCAFAFGG
jgi:hypothetical protein